MKSGQAAFKLNRRLQSRVRRPDGQTFDIQVTDISRPLASFWGEAPTAAEWDGEADFTFLVGHVALLKGKGRPGIRESRGSGCRLQVLVSEIQRPYSENVSERLAPFVEAKSRPDYLAGQQANSKEDLLGSWIESTNRLHLLADLTARINSTRKTGPLLGAIMEAAREVMEAEASSLMLLDRETGELVISVPTGPAEAEISGIRIPAGKGIAGWVASTGRPAVVADASSDPRFYGDVSGSGFQTRDVICVPLKDSKEEVIGALQVINKMGVSHFSESDVPLFTILAHQAAIAIERDRLNRESLQRRLMEQELFLASEIQKGFWPKNAPAADGVELAGTSVPAAHVGGDYYDFIEMGPGRIGLVVADVSGKGVAASLLMASLRAALRAQIENKHSVDEAVALVNATLVGDTPSSKFVTLFFGVLDSNKRELTYVNAGHNPPILFDSNSSRTKLLETGGPIIGFRSEISFEAGCEPLLPGQLLVVFSDGVTEAQNEVEEFFGDERLAEAIRENCRQSAGAVVENIQTAVKAFTGTAPQSDDMTLVVARIVD